MGDPFYFYFPFIFLMPSSFSVLDMQYTYTIYPEKNLAIVTGNGWIDLNMSLKAMDDLYKDPIFKSHYCVIVDLRRIEYLSSINDLKKIAHALVGKRDKFINKHALVMSGRYESLGELVSLYTTAEGFNLKVFTSFQDALNFMSDCIGQCDHTEFLNNE